MHITIPTDALRSLLEKTTRVATKHITLPILQCVRMEVKGNVLTLSATNLEIGIEGTVKGIGEEDGVLAVPAQIFLQTISLITQKEVTLSTQGDTLQLEAKGSKTEIKTMDANEFPLIPKVAGTSYTLNHTLFAYGIKTAAFAASQSSIKPELGSIYIFQKKEQSLTFVATDSFRLIEKTIAQKNLSFEGSLLIPFKNAIELGRIAEECESDLTICVGDNQCALETESLYITSRLVSGTFPDYEQIIPKEYTVEATILTSDIATALKKTSIFLNKFLQVTLTIGHNTITFSSQNSEAGATTESIAATTTGEELRLNFNQRYVSDILAHISDDSLRLKFAGIGRPLVIHNEHDASLRYLVMPMNK
jgi:DNA polymerase III subunit beta